MTSIFFFFVGFDKEYTEIIISYLNKNTILSNDL